jgi:hypothetical protein
MDPSALLPVGIRRPHSYRGYYERVAFEPVYPMPDDPHKDERRAGAMWLVARDALGQTFLGWKGGSYRMHAGSLVHLAEEGRTGPQVVGFGLLLDDESD